VPITALGKTVAVFIMLLGYAIIAVPTGIVSSELTKHNKEKKQDRKQSEIIEKEKEIISKENEILKKLEDLEKKIDQLR